MNGLIMIGSTVLTLTVVETLMSLFRRLISH